MEPRDGDDVLRIYEQGIQTGEATLTSETPSWHEWRNTYLKPFSFVALQGQAVVGWAALKMVSTRPVYSGVTDISIYIDEPTHRRGVGSTLMETIINASEHAGIWTIRAHMFPENIASVGLHKRFGFREVGISEKAGKALNGERAGRWSDVLLMERRSPVAGLD